MYNSYLKAKFFAELASEKKSLRCGTHIKSMPCIVCHDIDIIIDLKTKLSII